MTTTPRPRALKLAIASLLFLAGTLTVADRAQACSIKPYPDTFGTNGPPPDGAKAPDAPTSTKVEVTRSKYARPGNGDCGDVGFLELSFELAGTAWPANLGIWLRVVDGTLPPFMTLADKPMEVDSGRMAFGGGDLPSQAFDVTFQATTVNEYGVESAPITIHVTSTGKSDGGCSFVPHGKSPPAALLFLLGLFLFVRAKARKCSTN